jgi:Cof subfamily protein (haloacid dehalogenase superfamily)
VTTTGTGVRLIASDLDGTLLRSDGGISTRTRDALARAQSAGIAIVLASARGPQGVADVADALSVGGLAICSNGAVILDLETRRVIKHRPLAADVAARVVRAIRERDADIAFAAETEFALALEPAFDGAWDNWDLSYGSVHNDALEFVIDPVSKLLLRDDKRSIDELAALAREVVGDDCAVAPAGHWVLEISAGGVSKAAALEELANDLGVSPSAVVAFGDFPNDLPMLNWAGRSIAPGNAHPDVLAAVDEVTATNDGDGVALVIERLLLRTSLRA